MTFWEINSFVFSLRETEEDISFTFVSQREVQDANFFSRMVKAGVGEVTEI